ncbi:MAG: GntR family transcriptional regulator, transcriptional repressor for pyruvate dehydrogenase complex [Thermoleophilaceae bacterium]|jgi:GntR family transcriptional repressor for pyruvate dehydrogenase complex|nr:GntR family transcriptional regulator, transcriptional repressor for pyruvate dehydrogenase complex [Thermoleophilaceae bacterium]
MARGAEDRESGRAAESDNVRHALRPVRRSRLYEEVVERLRELIDVQGLRPGDRLMSERDLADRLGVSRTSVRQALTALEVTGLVDIRHGGGVFLARALDDVLPSLANELASTYEELPAVIEVREAIETQTARLAARRRSAGDLRAMHAALEEMEAAIESAGDPADADADFHTAIVRAARNQLLARLWDDLADPIDQTRRASLARPGRPPGSLAAHRLILAAIEAGDEDAAAQRMREHLSVVGDLGFLTSLR